MTRLDALVAAAREPWQLEASLRRTAGGVRAGRIMLESVPWSVVAEVAACFGATVPDPILRLVADASARGVPLIAGWDEGDGRAKLYVNGSDASHDVRRALRLAAGVAEAPLEAPHVIGVDLRRDAPPRFKLYQQDADAARLAALSGDSGVRALAADALAAGACAGAVMSWTADGQARAFFIATRAGAEPAIDALVRALPGWDPSALALLPFFDGHGPGPARSIGVALDGSGDWTVYFKRRGVHPVASLEPAAQFRAGSAEVGVFVEPSAVAAHAFARTATHAVSYRLREGAPAPRDIEALMTWACARLAAAERAGSSPDDAFADPPPAPWRRA